MNHILGWITDAKNRPEIKAVLGIVMIVSGLLFAIIGGIWILANSKQDSLPVVLSISGFLFTTGLGLFGITAAADSKIDAVSGTGK